MSRSGCGQRIPWPVGRSPDLHQPFGKLPRNRRTRHAGTRRDPRSINSDQLFARATRWARSWADCRSSIDDVERVTRIELVPEAWEAAVLPLNYTRIAPPILQLRTACPF
jgi:hypothetical protein